MSAHAEVGAVNWAAGDGVELACGGETATALACTVGCATALLAGLGGGTMAATGCVVDGAVADGAAEASDDEDIAADDASEEDEDASDKLLLSDDINFAIFCAVGVESGAVLHAVMVTTDISATSATDKMTLSLLMAWITPYLIIPSFSALSFLSNSF